MKISSCFEALDFQCHFVLRLSEVRKLVHTNLFQVKSTKMGTARKFATLQYLRKSADRKAQISSVSETSAELIFALRSADFLGYVFITLSNVVHNLFFYFQTIQPNGSRSMAEYQLETPPEGGVEGWCPAVPCGPLGFILLITMMCKKRMYLWSVDEFMEWHTMRNLKSALNVLGIRPASGCVFGGPLRISFRRCSSIKPQALPRTVKRVV